MKLEKSYTDFISIVNSKSLEIVSREDSTYYHLIAKDGIVFYETFVPKNGGADQQDYENNRLASSLNYFSDGGIPVAIPGGEISAGTSKGLFTKPYTSLVVLTKNDSGDPLTIKSIFQGTDKQLLTIVYDDDGDFLSANVSDL